MAVAISTFVQLLHSVNGRPTIDDALHVIGLSWRSDVIAREVALPYVSCHCLPMSGFDHPGEAETRGSRRGLWSPETRGAYWIELVTARTQCCVHPEA
jgi:hypothetical protein